MYRTTIDGKEIIITLAPKIRKEITDRNPLYEAVFHNLLQDYLQTKQPTFAVNHEIFGLIIGEVQRGEVTVFAVEHIIRSKIYLDRTIFLGNRTAGKFVK